MSLTRDEVRRVATLARLELTPAEEELFAAQLGRVVDYIDQLARFEVAEPAVASSQPAAGGDAPGPCLPVEIVLANAPRSEGALVVVPKVLDADA
jgi:aspartyl-tRNA(Asn)/glutamyl-tRNA(Gln) amidotransferase subunit C